LQDQGVRRSARQQASWGHRVYFQPWRPDNLAMADRNPDPAPSAADAAIAATRHWLEAAVIGLNLCPFAKAVHVKQQIRWVCSSARDQDRLLADLEAELLRLAESDPAAIDTTLLIHPEVLGDFDDYNQFLDLAEATLEALELDGVIQIASFHPQYRFADGGPDDIEHHTNRSPHPMLHLLREDSVEAALASHPDPDGIFERNQATLRRLGHAGWARLFEDRP
jgi:uncharacterized protein